MMTAYFDFCFLPTMHVEKIAYPNLRYWYFGFVVEAINWELCNSHLNPTSLQKRELL